MKLFLGSIVAGSSLFLMGLGIADGAMAANPKHVARLLKTNQCPLCDLQNADLEAANLYGANLVGANLSGANLRGANLGAVNLADANLTNANLDRAYLRQVTFEDANFQGATLTNAYLKGADLNRVNLIGAKLQNANLSRTNLVQTQLKNADLSQANLAGAFITGVTVPPDFGRLSQAPGQIRTSLCERDTKPTEQELASAKKAGFELSFANLAGVNFRGANLRGAVLVAGNLRRVDLRDADLTNACLNLADLTEAKLDRANLKDAKLQATLFERASLQDVQNADLSLAYRSTADAKRVPIEAQTKRVTVALARAQQKFQIEKIQFAKSIKELGVPTSSFTKEYDYKVIPGGSVKDQVMVVAQPKKSGYRSFIGVVAVVVNTQTQAARPSAVLCESEKPTQKLPLFPKLKAGEKPTCPTGYKAISR
ncbi:pentapeptide repeat-containing protein [filamentous cyanobacterium LEGE 11480]|uniref:Pentapeptide repeat-containing protein n=1 Tax=Romeriopsis navalis LEGE 11480 TaxID=2777977 RepID=A0A928VWK2_9CYAN|nr:pentapeptide repeat-containing protein [Romeriopsis navalis]MBE9033339.1 pentapeptide repeat-containing protein [Romeriopsis navalis LEGE 11480]